MKQNFTRVASMEKWQPTAARLSFAAEPGASLSEGMALRGRSLLDEFVIPPEIETTLPEAKVAGRVLMAVRRPTIGGLLVYCLAAAGFKVRTTKSLADGVTEVRRFLPDVLLVDSVPRDFPDTDVWRRMRVPENGGIEPAVVFLAGSDDEPDVHELGPADRVSFPFSIRDLVVRLDDITRARRGIPASDEISPARGRYLIGPLELDIEGHYALVNGVEVHISALEMRLLSDLVEHRGRVRTRRELLAEVWGYSDGVSTRTPDTHVNRLRMKLGAAGALVETVRGIGYRLSAEFPVVVKK